MTIAESNKLRCIHVGVGTRGKSHIRAALEGGYWKPVALVDVVPEYIAAARETTGLPESACFSRVEDAIAAVEADAVMIASPVTLHAQQIMASLQGGKHVLTEKCFTVALSDAQQCVAEAERRKLKLMVFQNARRYPPMRTLRRLIAEQRYGPLGMFLMSFYKPRGAPYNRSPHMHLWQQGVHELDSIRGVVQQKVNKVWGLSNHPAWCDWPSPSTVQAILEFDKQITGTFVSTSNARSDGFEFRLECADAAVISSRSGGDIQIRWGPKNRKVESVPLDQLDVRGLEHHPAARAVLESGGERSFGGLIDMQIYRDFYEYITHGADPETTGRDNIETIQLLDAIERSTAESRAIIL